MRTFIAIVFALLAVATVSPSSAANIASRHTGVKMISGALTPEVFRKVNTLIESRYSGYKIERPWSVDETGVRTTYTGIKGNMNSGKVISTILVRLTWDGNVCVSEIGSVIIGSAVVIAQWDKL